MKRWLLYSLITVGSFGVWGAFIEVPEKAGFPATLGYSVWALMMIPCAAVAMSLARWRLDRDTRAVALGSIVGLTGAGGQLLLFEALRHGPAYLVFPIVSLYPVVTIMLSVAILKERASRRGWLGIATALPAMALLSWQQPSSAGAASAIWVPMTLLVFGLWGVQAFFMKFANDRMSAESIFFYMTASALALIPAAVWMTDFSQHIEWGLRGPGAAAAIQVLNAIGALSLVYAIRYGKAIIVVPLTSLAPLLTILISLALYHVIPGPVLIAGMALAATAMLLLAE